MDSTGSITAKYAQGAGIDEPLAMSRNGVTDFYNADGLGSVTSLFDATGTAAASYTYSSFGSANSTSGTVTNPFQYTGREADSETGLYYYYRARYYSPVFGRFISEDPMRFAGGIDAYTYAANSPIHLIDPFGLQSITGPVTSSYPSTPSPAEVEEGLQSVQAATEAEAAGGAAAAAGAGVAAATVGVAAIDVGLGWYDYSQFRKLCTASGWSWCSTPPLNASQNAASSSASASSATAEKQKNKCESKSKDDCWLRFLEEKRFCSRYYPGTLYGMCVDRAKWCFNACIAGGLDPGSLDPLDPDWSLN